MYKFANKEIFFIPAYVQLVVKSLRNMNMPSRTVDCVFTLIIKIYWKNLDPNLKKDIEEKKIMIRINELPLKNNDCWNTQSHDDFFTITIRDVTTLRVQADVVDTPFDKI